MEKEKKTLTFRTLVTKLRKSEEVKTVYFLTGGFQNSKRPSLKNLSYHFEH